MKKIILIVLLIVGGKLNAQDQMMTAQGIVHFDASIPLFEEVKASNDKTTCILITKTGQITCWMNIKDFKFKRNLMQEHFNEYYMESNRFPRAVFRGKIEKFDLKSINVVAKEYQINGEITIHGRTKKLGINAFLRRADQQIELTSKFPLNTDDFMIEIPLIIRSKIATTANTQLICVLQ